MRWSKAFILLLFLVSFLLVAGCSRVTSYFDREDGISRPLSANPPVMLNFNKSKKQSALVSSSPASPPLSTGAKEAPPMKISLDTPPSIAGLASGQTRPPRPEEVQDQLSELGEEWFFGPGLGRTALNVTGIIIFPPYGLYLLGNAGIQLFGYDPLYVTDALPPGVKEKYDTAYESVTEVPGRLNTWIFNHTSSYGGQHGE